MNDFAIQVNNLSKRYRIGLQQARYRTLRESLVSSTGRVLQQARSIIKKDGDVQQEQPGYFWALKDITFEIPKGEAIGIIGRNGAGKSTLLKVLARVTEPTTGSVDLYGRIGSLLEVGTGFHPELTGRENIYLNGAILGMTRVEIEKKFDEIVDFAEVEKFLDTPVKHYSSGMYLRLAFAVAAHLEPEILLVDEVLAVGDAQFQKKCLGKMGEVAKEGRTVLFVSHNMAAIQSLCSRALWIQDGRIQEAGEAIQVVSDYLKESFSSQTESTWNDVQTAPGNDQVRLRRVCVRPENGSSYDPITIRTPLVMEFEYWNLKPGAHINLSLHLLNEQGTTIFNTFPITGEAWLGSSFPSGLFRSAVHIPGDLLNDGLHRLTLLIVRDQSSVIFRMDDALSFDVQDSIERRPDWHGKWIGAVRPFLKWETEMVEPTLEKKE